MEANKYFSFLTTPLSFARKTHTRQQYVLYFIIGTLLEGIFLFLLFYFFELRSFLLLTITVIGLISSALIGLTTSHSVRKFHTNIAIFFILIMILWSFVFHILLFSISPIHNLFGLALSGMALVGIPYFYFKMKSIGYSELYFILVLTLWNILMSTLYFIHY